MCYTINAVRTLRDPVEPVPVGSYVAMVFRVQSYSPDCDGSLLATLAQVDSNGMITGLEVDSVRLHNSSDVVLGGPGDLQALAT